MAIIEHTYIHTYIKGLRPRSLTVHIYVAISGNIIGKLFFIMAKCRGNRGELSQRAQRASVVTL